MFISFLRKPFVTALAAVSALTLLLSANTFAQSVAPAYQQNFHLENLGAIPGQPTQMTFGPDGRLYIMTTGAGVHSYAYDPVFGTLSDHKVAVANVGGIGIAFHHRDMYLTVFDENYTDSIMKLTDTDENGVWGETDKGEKRVKIVKGIPVGDHDVDQLIIKGDTLYVGIGRRTIAGRRGAWTMGSHSDDPNDKGFWGGGTGKSFGDAALNGTICWIRDLNLVPDEEDAANPYGKNVVKNEAFYQQNDSPVSDNNRDRKDLLVVHSAGTRNPFGLCLDRNGELWFTSNFNRTMTSGNGQANDSFHGDPGQGGDWPQPDFSRSIHDQLFHAAEGADYGYHDDNWRGKSPFLPDNILNSHRVYSTTFDNLFNKGPYRPYNPAEPVGLGPNSSSDGCSFFYSPGLPHDLEGNIFIARYNGAVTENRPGGVTLSYQDLVAVDVRTGRVRRVAQDFNQPVSVLWDGHRRLLIGDIGNNTIYALYNVVNPEPYILSIDPHRTLVGSDTFTMEVHGKRFTPGSQVNFDATALNTTFVSETVLTAIVPANLLTQVGHFAITVTRPAPGGGTSNPATFEVVNRAPVLTSVDPNEVSAGSPAIQITLTGEHFAQTSQVWFGDTLLTSAFISPTKLTATVPADVLVRPRYVLVQVITPGGGRSVPMVFRVKNPVPVLTELSPNTVTEDRGEFHLTARGSHFVPNSVIRIDGHPLATTFVSDTELSAVVGSHWSAEPGIHRIVVTNPLPGGGESKALSLTVVPGQTTLKVVSDPRPAVYRHNDALVVWVMIRNLGNYDARDVQITSAKLNTTASSLIEPGSSFLIRAGGYVWIRLRFPGDAAPKGSTPTLTLRYESKNAGSETVTVTCGKVP